MSPPSSLLSLSLALPLLFFSRLATAQSSSKSSSLATLSITSYLPYAAQRECVKDCLYDGSDWVGSLIGCGSPYYNLCYCNQNFASNATSWISTCVSSVCSGGLDAPTAVSIYTAYCAGAGLPLGVAAQTTQDMPASGTPVTQTLTGLSTMQLSGGSVTTVPVTITSVVTSVPSPGQSNPTQAPATAAATATSSSSAPVGAIVGAALGGAAVLGIAAVLIVYFVLRHKRWLRTQQQGQFQQLPQEPKPTSPGSGVAMPMYSSPVSQNTSGYEGQWGGREMDGHNPAMLSAYGEDGRPKVGGYSARELPG